MPNAALRWKPRPKQIPPDNRAKALAEMNSRGERPKPAGDRKANAKPKDSAKSPARHS